MSRSRNSWRCTRRGDCKARFFISAGTVFTNFQHNHAPYVYEIRNVEFVLSQRGAVMLAIGERRFSSQKRYGSKTRWECSTHRSKGCRAIVVTFYNEVIKFNNHHNH
ncbi:FLYWCH zinc finger domain-containing protein [Phthorimaea operculella]|nr:FLYWCH zinc finger domain-containing protein [Phthorimaea operculella]